MKPGRHTDISSEVYHSHEAENRGAMVEANKAVALWEHHKTSEMADSTALRFGRAFHRAALEPLDYNPITVDVKTSRSKEFTTALEAAESEEDVLLLWEAQRIQNMLAALWADDLASALLSSGAAEVTYVWEDTDTGILCRARSDWEGGTYLADLKTTSDISPQGFAESCRKYRYDIQAALYCDGACECGVQVVDGMRFIAVDKSKPHLVQVYQLSPEDVRRGREDYKRALNRIKEAREGRVPFRGYFQGIKTLSLWAA